MKLFSLRNCFATSLVALLAACGGGQAATDTPLQTAAVMQTVAVSGPAGDNAAPQPDCAPEKCQGLRIIDGNAEAFRVDAKRRAALEAGEGVPQV